MPTNVLESKTAELERFRAALDVARAKGISSYDTLIEAPPRG